MEEDINFDIAVVGAGPAGIMAAGIAAEMGAKGSPVGLRPRVVLIEKNKQLGRKFLLTGNGRSNLTNAEFGLKELVKNYDNGEFLFHVFSVFGPEKTLEFFKRLGVETKIERNSRVFPAGDKAKEVLDLFENYLTENKVKILFNSEVVDVFKKGNKIDKLILNNGEIKAKKYIFCAGGKAYPTTGSNGLVYNLAEKLGHTIVKPLPALSPIRTKEGWVKSLQGISLADVKINVFSRGAGPRFAGQNSQKKFSEEGEFLFTGVGVSGPAVLNISGKVAELQERGQVKIYFDLFPLLNQEELNKGLEDVLKKYPRQSAKNILASFVPERLAEVLLDLVKIDRNKIANNMSKVEKASVVKILKNIEVTPEDVLGFSAQGGPASGWDQALVTRGGVSLKEIDHKTMKSKIIDNLFFAGEIIDVDGKSGGFNLQLCWSTGYLAGKNAAGF